MTVVDLIQGSELQLSPLSDLKAEFQKVTDKFFTDLDKNKEAGPIKDLFKKYQESCHDIVNKFKKQIEERKRNTDAAVKSLQIEANVDKKNQEDKEKKDETKTDQTTEKKKEGTEKPSDKAKEEKKLAQIDDGDAEGYTDLSELLSEDENEVEEGFAETDADQTSEPAKDSKTSDSKSSADSSSKTDAKPTTKDDDKKEKEKKEEDKEPLTHSDENTPLGKLVKELKAIQHLSDADIVSVMLG